MISISYTFNSKEFNYSNKIKAESFYNQETNSIDINYLELI